MNELEKEFMRVFDQYVCAIISHGGYMNEDNTESDYIAVGDAALFMMEIRDQVMIAQRDCNSIYARAVGDTLDNARMDENERIQKILNQ